MSTGEEGLTMRVVGVGASAGGLEALEQFFAHMPPDTGLAFVVVQHLAPDFKSLMDELLRRHTSMPIHVAGNGQALAPNTLFLIPPRADMIVSGGHLMLSERDTSKGLNLPIDLFFRSLATEFGARAVGIVLSGTGSDGSRGVVAIREAGGTVLCQSPETASFDGMPNSAIATGAVDAVLSPSEMPDYLLKNPSPIRGPLRLRASSCDWADQAS
jgi:two-component system CheB/CheR fusion protein